MKKAYYYYPYIKEKETEIIKYFKEDNKHFAIAKETIFYPHLSGGQLGDTGYINDIKVLHIEEKNGEILHQLEKEIEEGQCLLKIDWNKRFDHMQQHTAQHIISGLYRQLFSIETIGFSMGEKESTIDLKSINIDEMKDINKKIFKLANQLILAALPIHRSFDNSKEINGEPYRTIEIPTIGAEACGGTHVANTAEIIYIKSIKLQKDREHIRLYYKAGNRCINEYENILKYVNKWAINFQTDLHSALDRVDTLIKENSELKKENIDFKKQFKAILKSNLENLIEIIDDKKVLWTFIDTDFSPHDIVPNNLDLVLLVNKNGETIIRSKENIDKYILNLREKYNFKGGGRNGEYSGKFETDDLLKLVKDLKNKFYYS